MGCCFSFKSKSSKLFSIKPTGEVLLPTLPSTNNANVSCIIKHHAILESEQDLDRNINRIQRNKDFIILQSSKCEERLIKKGASSISLIDESCINISSKMKTVRVTSKEYSFHLQSALNLVSPDFSVTGGYSLSGIGSEIYNRNTIQNDSLSLIVILEEIDKNKKI